MRQIWFLGLVAVTVAPSLGEEKSPVDRGAKFLQGEWVVVGIEDEGFKATKDELKGMKWSVKGNVITATNPDGSTGKMRYKLNPRKTPKEIDLTVMDGPLKGTTDPGIYDFRKGRLRICYREPGATADIGRPQKFAAPRKSGLGIIILKKKTK